ncbi:MAG: MaoC/PaaZ C-terminal domain-containing protein [Caulobacterales bacterium]
MPLNVHAILSHRFKELRQQYTERDAILYALGLGLGADALDQSDLDYLLETRGKALPFFAVTMASPGMWMRDPTFGVTFSKLVHSAQEATFHAPLPARAEVNATPCVAGLYDRGEDRGAVLIVEREIRDAQSQTLYCTVRQTLLLRGDGGFGGNPPPKLTSAPIPNRTADNTYDVRTSTRAALIYRLSGDWNPLHADPEFAKTAGFEKPILHGLASYGIAGRGLMKAYNCSISFLRCQFSGIVFPGDSITFKTWDGGGNIAFEAFVGDRKVLANGLAEKGV